MEKYLLIDYTGDFWQKDEVTDEDKALAEDNELDIFQIIDGLYHFWDSGLDEWVPVDEGGKGE